MIYRVLIPKSVQKEIDRLPASVADSVIVKLKSLQDIPRPTGSLKLHGSDCWRIRLGDYRLIYDINDKDRVVIVRKIGHRREIYR